MSATAWTRRAGLALIVPALALAAGCGSGSSGSGDGGTGGGSSAKASTIAAAKAFVEQAMNGNDRPLPASAPAPQPGKKVWVLSCSQAAEGCQVPAAGAAEAGKMIGWKMTVFDGKGDPATYAKGVRSAIAAKADGIILVSIDCAAIKAPLDEAHKAGIKVFGFYGVDCDDPFAGGGKKEFDGQVDYGKQYGSFTQAVQDRYARLIADYTIMKTNGKANIIALTEDDIVVVHYIWQGYLKWIARDCPDCKVTKLPIALSDLLQGKVQGKIQAALTKNPTANAVFAPYDSAVTLGAAAAVKASGRDQQILLTGGEGLTPNIAMIRKGQGQDFAAGAPARWAGFATVDGLNRVFHGQPTVDEGIGQAVIDKDHNLPTKTTFYDGTSDYEANFKKIWGPAQ
jgi:ribose transport system substrate-binding protein